MAVFEPLFKALNEAHVRYVVVGGLAVVLHGHARLTADVDLIVDLEESEALKVVEALLDAGMKPRLPVDARQFAKSDVRNRWARERGMQVFSLYDPANPMRAVDLFVRHPVPFEDLWGRSVVMPLESLTVRVASIRDLIELKRQAGRPRDLEDISHLEDILRRQGTE